MSPQNAIEEHASMSEEVRALGASVLRKSVTKRTPVTKRQVGPERPTVKPSKPAPRPGGRPRLHETNAERQRAYRERSK